MNLSHSLYQIFFILISPILKGIVFLRTLKGKEDKSRLNERWGVPSIEKRPQGKLHWIHAVSVGEAISALIIIKLLKEQSSNCHILLTTGTVTSANLMNQSLPDGVIHQYLPLDTPFATRSFLDFWEPNSVFWIESEIWPNILMEIHKRNCPLYLMNGRMSERSFSIWKRVPFFIQPLMKAFTWCGVQTKKDLAIFTELGAPCVEVMPNLKLLADEPSYDKNELKSFENALERRPVWFASCTHEGEEEMILETHQQFLKSHPDGLLFLAPRHIYRAKKLMENLKKLKISFGLRSADKTPDLTHKIYLIDSMGELGLFYKISAIVFIGGTWVPKGGHNPVEAAQMGAYIFHGSSIESNSVLYEILGSQGLAKQVNDPADLSSHLHRGAPKKDRSWEDTKKQGLMDLQTLLGKFTNESKDVAC